MHDSVIMDYDYAPSYSSRFQFIMTCVLGWVTTMEKRTSKIDHILHRYFQSPDVLDYVEIQQRETYNLLKGLLDDPQD